MTKLELSENPLLKRVTPNEVSSDTTQLLEQNNLASIGGKTSDFLVNEKVESSKQSEKNKRNASGLTRNTHNKGSMASFITDSKLTQHYSQMWENEEDR